MATDWAADVKKYAPKADDAAIAGIVKYCGIALRNRDSALVSFSDKAETDRVRANFLKKKLGLTQADSVLDAAIAKVGAQMKADRTKNRVTVYYLLASEFNQLGQFVKAAPAPNKAAARTVPVKTAAAKTVPAKAAAKPVAVKSVAKPTVAKSTVAKPAAAKLTSAKFTTTQPSPAPKAKIAPKPVSAAALVVGTAAAAKIKPAKPAPVKAKAAPAPAKVTAQPAAAKPAPAKQSPPTPKVSSPAKATTAKAAAPANNATQGMLDKAASTASDAGKAPPKAAPVAAAATLAAAGLADASTMMAGGTKPAASPAATTGTATPASSAAAATPVDDGSEMGWLWWVIGLAVLAFLAWFLFARGPDAPDNNATEAAASAAASDVGTDLAAAPAEGTLTIPAGAGVTSEMRNGKPVVKVYFDTAKTDLSPDFAKTAGGLKSWLDTHSGSTVAISGFSDPSGNAKANADLSKVRAQTVQAGLVAAGIPSAAAMLVKPDVTADASVSPEAARRVEVVVN